MAVYILTYVLLFYIYYIYGSYIKSKKKYWLNSIVPIALFSFIEGARYLRGVDYAHYALFYSNPYLMKIEEDIGFEYLNNFLRTISTEPQLAFTVYALITIVSLFIFLKPFNEIHKIVFFIMLVFTIHSSEWIIRQFISIAIMFASISFLIQRKYTSFILFAFLSCSIHYSSIIFLFIILFFYFLVKNPIKWQYSVSIIIIVMLFNFSDVITNLISKLLNTLNLGFLEGKSYLSYIERSDDFLNSNSAGKVTGERSIYTTILNLLFYIISFIEGNEILKKYNIKKAILIYNLFIIGSIGTEFFLKYELFVRIFRPMELLAFIPVSYILISSKSCKFKISYYYILLFVMLTMGKFVFFPPENFYLFIWDKIG